MNLQLKQIRQSKGFSQESMAEKLSDLMEQEIKVSRYGTWERGDRMMSLEQAYYCAVALNVTLNDLVGMESGSLSGERRDLVDSYDRMDDDNKRLIMDNAHALAVASELKKTSHGRHVAMVGDDVRDGGR